MVAQTGRIEGGGCDWSEGAARDWEPCAHLVEEGSAARVSESLRRPGMDRPHAFGGTGNPGAASALVQAARFALLGAAWVEQEFACPKAISLGRRPTATQRSRFSLQAAGLEMG